ncbi:hypothetical protein RRG08_058934 [Elysia crispata]|uniref:Uncharacterized protein n=1 Tax=Elysia crispata TaxID=231223 RepID=A0AAE1CKS7_9GAST|nr:hypothetical protein RRG08_058934 [Elysia crispata]
MQFATDNVPSESYKGMMTLFCYKTRSLSAWVVNLVCVSGDTRRKSTRHITLTGLDQGQNFSRTCGFTGFGANVSTYFDVESRVVPPGPHLDVQPFTSSTALSKESWRDVIERQSPTTKVKVLISLGLLEIIWEL